MNNFDIIYAHENFFKPDHNYSPSDFYSIFNSFCDCLKGDDIDLLNKLDNLEGSGDYIPVYKGEDAYTSYHERRIEFSAYSVYNNSKRMAAAMEEGVLAYIREHIREYEPDILAEHINLVECDLVRENDLTGALYNMDALYIEALRNWVTESGGTYERIHALTNLPATDGNFLSSLKQANEVEMNIAVSIMGEKEGNIGRIKKITTAIKKFEKEQPEKA